MRRLETRDEEETVQVVLFDYNMGTGVEFWENEATKVRCQQFHSWEFTLEKLRLIFMQELAYECS